MTLATKHLMWTRTVPLVLLSLALLGSEACHHHPPPDSRAGPPRGEIAIRVINRSVSDVVIEMVDGGIPSRLGTAYGGATDVFFVPWERVQSSGSLRLLGDPIGSTQAIVTDRLTVRPGSMVVWTIEPVLTQSNAAVY